MLAIFTYRIGRGQRALVDLSYGLLPLTITRPGPIERRHMFSALKPQVLDTANDEDTTDRFSKTPGGRPRLSE